MRSRMALTTCSQFLADIGRTEAMSSSRLHFSNQSNSRCSEFFTLCPPHKLSAFVPKIHVVWDPENTKVSLRTSISTIALREDPLKWPANGSRENGLAGAG